MLLHCTTFQCGMQVMSRQGLGIVSPIAVDVVSLRDIALVGLGGLVRKHDATRVGRTKEESRGATFLTSNSSLLRGAGDWAWPDGRR